MVKAIEENADVPVVHMLTIVPISLSVGANRLIPTVAIPHPLGNPALSAEEEYKLRYGLVTRALKALQTPVTEQTVFAAD
jgi:glycine reductase